MKKHTLTGSAIWSCCLLFCGMQSLIPLHAQDTTASKSSLKKDADYFFKEENYQSALPFYLKLLAYDSVNVESLYHAGICFLYKSDQPLKAIELLEKIPPDNSVAKDISYYLGRAYHLNYRFDDAMQQFTKTLAAKKISETIRLMTQKYMNYCINAKKLLDNKLKVEIINIGIPINTDASEYFPVITADESMMIFTCRGPKSKGGRMDQYGKPDPRGQYFEDVMVSWKKGDSWTVPRNISDSINTPKHDACIALSVDGQKLFTYKDNPGLTSGDIYISMLDSAEWTVPVRLNKINSNEWEGSASISSDLRTIYFASERPGGYGGRDIYLSRMLPTGEWGIPENIGPNINSPNEEDAPFIHPDGKTLYFSSTGHNSMGGYDIFFSHLAGKSDSAETGLQTSPETKWSEPQNIGFPINTTGDDKFYVVSADGRRGYFSSARAGGHGQYDIYIVNQNKAHILMLAKGHIYTNDVLAEAKINVTYAEENKIMDYVKGNLQGSYKSNAASGKYLLALSAGGNYNASFEVDGFLPRIENFNASAIDTFVEVTRDIEVYSAEYAAKFTTVDGVISEKENPSEIMSGKTLFIKSYSGNVLRQVITDRKGYFKCRKIPKNEKYIFSMVSDKSAIVTGIVTSGGNPEKGLSINDTLSKEDGSYFVEIKGLRYCHMEGNVTLKDTTPEEQPLMIFLTTASGRISRQVNAGVDNYFTFAGLPSDEIFFISLSTYKSAGVKGKISYGTDPQPGVPVNESVTDKGGKFSLTFKGQKEDIFSGIKKAKVGTKIILKNIFFDFDRVTLSPESAVELDRLVSVLNENNTIKIEISGHTDNKGTDEYNRKLSEERANAVVIYLVEQGIAKDRLVYKGYGEQFPVAGNDKESGRQMNRRTEFKILSK